MANYQWLIDKLLQEKYPTYDDILGDALSRVPDTIDKRQGSLVFTALAPACYKLAEYYDALRDLRLNTNILTATGDSLDIIGVENGLMRLPETKALLNARVEDIQGNPITIPIGSRFSSRYAADTLFYTVVQDKGSGDYVIESELSGSVGNTYLGELFPITYITNIGVAEITSVYVAGRDREDDDSLRERVVDSTLYQAFGGNLAQYRELMLTFSGVGHAQIYPAGDGAGTVVISVLDNAGEPISSTYRDELKEALDPLTNEGEGIGLAPINHKIRVTTGAKLPINITVKVTASAGYTQPQLEQSIRTAILSYFLEVIDLWDNPNSLNRYESKVYHSQMLTKIGQIQGVVSVVSLTINGGANDISLTQTPSTQQIPSLGTLSVTI